jgi:hypothetical protein
METPAEEKVATIHARHTVVVAIISGLLGVVTTLITVTNQVRWPSVIRIADGQSDNTKVTELRERVSTLERDLFKAQTVKAEALNTVPSFEIQMSDQKAPAHGRTTAPQYIRLQLCTLPPTVQSCTKTASQALSNSGFLGLISDNASIVGQRDLYKASVACYGVSSQAVLVVVGPDRAKTSEALDRLFLEFKDLF